MMTRKASTSCGLRPSRYRSAILATSSLVGGVIAIAISQCHEESGVGSIVPRPGILTASRGRTLLDRLGAGRVPPGRLSPAGSLPARPGRAAAGNPALGVEQVLLPVERVVVRPGPGPDLAAHRPVAIERAFQHALAVGQHRQLLLEFAHARRGNLAFQHTR